MLNILKKENLELTTILLNNHKEDNENTGGWRYSEFIDMYLNYLSENKKEIPLFLKDQFLLEARENKRFSSFHEVDKDIETYFNLLNVMNSKEITNQFFKENLELYCSMVNDDTRELENYARCLNFDSQKRIYEYVNTFLPENSSEYTEYFQDLLPTPVFKTQRLYQSSIEINLYQIMFENGLNQKSSQHLNNIIKECLNVVSSDNFLRLINEDIKVFNTSVKEKAAGLKLNFSTETYEDLEKFEKIILKSLKGVVKVQDKIKLRWTDSFYGEDQLLTNMDAKFILQQYLHETLNEDLKKNETKPRKNKV